jgi:hypothetical protein
MTTATQAADFEPAYSPWRHGGWYVTNVRYPSGGCGCVSSNYADRKWRIVCDPRPDAHELHTYPNRDAAARAEYELVRELVAAPHTYRDDPYPGASDLVRPECSCGNWRWHGYIRPTIAHAIHDAHVADIRARAAS